MTVRRIELFAVQMCVSAADYSTSEAFVRKVSSIFESVDAARTRDRRGRHRFPALVVFPEEVGTFLFLAPHYRVIQDAPTLDVAVRRIARRKLPSIVWMRARHRASTANALFLMTARQTYELHHRTFSCLARRHQVSVVAGSLLVPENLYGATGTFQLRPPNTGVYNLSVTFDARGEVIHSTRKAGLMRGLEHLLEPTDEALEELLPFEALGARIGNAVGASSRDGPASIMSIGKQLLDKGAEILVQPSSLSDTTPEPGGGAPATPGHSYPRDRLIELMKARAELRYVVVPGLSGTILNLDFFGAPLILGRDQQDEPAVLATCHRSMNLAPDDEVVKSIAVLPARSRLEPPPPCRETSSSQPLPPPC